MSADPESWMAAIVADPARREQERRKAAAVESVLSLGAAALAIVAVWGFTRNAPVGGLPAASVGGLALLCFVAFMVMAAGAGIRRRFIALVAALEARRTPS